MPADDALADIPYISGDPFFERISKMREECVCVEDAKDDLKTPLGSDRERSNRIRINLYSRKMEKEDIKRDGRIHI